MKVGSGEKIAADIRVVESNGFKTELSNFNGEGEAVEI